MLTARLVEDGVLSSADSPFANAMANLVKVCQLMCVLCCWG